MIGKRTSRHYSDADLLSFLDGELNWLERSRARLHLFRCWECRARKADFETQAHRLARALQQDIFPGPGRVADAKAAFAGWRRTQAAPPLTVTSTARIRRLAAWASLSAAAPILAAAALVNYYAGTPSVPPLNPGLLTPRAPSWAWQTSRTPDVSPARSPGPQKTAAAASPRVNGERARTNASGGSLEIEVHYRLHRIGACTAEPVLVTRKDDGPIVVSAVGPPASKEREIRAALVDLERSGHVSIDITEVSQDAIASDALGSGATKIRLAPASPDSALSRRFGTPEDFQRRSTAILQSIDTIYAHAWALRKHTEASDGGVGLARPAFWLREAMQREHSGKLREALVRLKEQLTPVHAEAELQEEKAQREVFALASELTALVHRLFAPLAAPLASDEDLWRLSGLLAGLEREASRLELADPRR